MQEYFVSIEINVNADNPKHAAERAWDMLNYLYRNMELELSVKAPSGHVYRPLISSRAAGL